MAKVILNAGAKKESETLTAVEKAEAQGEGRYCKKINIALSETEKMNEMRRKNVKPEDKCLYQKTMDLSLLLNQNRS